MSLRLGRLVNWWGLVTIVIDDDMLKGQGATSRDCSLDGTAETMRFLTEVDLKLAPNPHQHVSKSPYLSSLSSAAQVLRREKIKS